jgi:hypothetical protein
VKQRTYLLQMSIIRLGRGMLSAWYEWLRAEHEESKTSDPLNESKDVKET